VASPVELPHWVPPDIMDIMIQRFRVHVVKELIDMSRGWQTGKYGMDEQEGGHSIFQIAASWLFHIPWFSWLNDG
jgi:hypothetical protein